MLMVTTYLENHEKSRNFRSVREKSRKMKNVRETVLLPLDKNG